MHVPSIVNYRVATVPLQTNHDHEKHGTVGSSVVGDHIAEFPDVLGVEEVIKSGLGDAGEGFVGGANTVKGPAPERVSTSLPALRAVTRVERSGVATARSTMVLPAVNLAMVCGGGEDVVNDVHNAVGIDVSGVYFGGVDEDVVVVEEPRLLCLQQPWSSRGSWGPWRARNRKQREDLRWRT